MGLPFLGILGSSELQKTSWFLEYSGGFPVSSQVLPDGRFYIVSRQQILFFDKYAKMLWQRSYADPATNTYTDAYIDSTGSILVTGYSDATYPSPQYVIKIDTSGNLLWQRQISVSTSVGNDGAVKVDSSDNVYVTFSHGSGTYGADRTGLIKFNSSGTVQWSLLMTGGSGTKSATSSQILSDSSGNIYVSNYGYDTSISQSASHLTKINSSGGVVWQKKYSHSSGSVQAAPSDFIDTDGSIYFFARPTLFSAVPLIAFKTDSTGNIAWQTALQGGPDYFGIGTTATNSTGHYVSYWGVRSGDAAQSILLMKYSLAGVLQFQRYLLVDSSSIYNALYTAQLLNGSFYSLSYVPSTSKYVFIKLPADGSKTGVYVGAGHTWSYAANNATTATSGISAAAGDLSISSSSFTITTPTVALSTPSVTTKIRTF